MGCTQSREETTFPGHRGIGATERGSRVSAGRAPQSMPAENGVEKSPPALDMKGNLMPIEVQKRRLSSTVSLDVLVCESSNPTKLSYAYCTQRGYYPDDPHKTNHDTFSVLKKFLGEKEDYFFAVYDGHGPFGDQCANFAKKDLPKSINKFSKQIRVQKFKETNDALPKEKRLPFNPKLFPKLTAEEWEDVIQKAHIECNEKLVKKPISKLSGTTAISVLFSDGHIIVSNVGDSRAILGFRAPADMSPSDLEYDVEEEKIEVSPAQDDEVTNIFDEGKLYPIPLSSDQTPWRLDERKRILKAGGRILTSDQMEELEPVTDDWGDVVLGEDIDTEGTIPRVWLQDKDIPGTSFTRSIGDSIAESCGVNAEPEILKKRLYKNHEYLVIASDGVFEFLPNQTVIDICDKCTDPLEACEEIVKASYAEWLRHEDRTDDITVIVFFMKNETEIMPKSQDLNLIKSLAPRNIKK